MGSDGDGRSSCWRGTGRTGNCDRSEVAGIARNSGRFAAPAD